MGAKDLMTGPANDKLVSACVADENANFGRDMSSD